MEIKGTVSFAAVEKTPDGHTHVCVRTFEHATVKVITPTAAILTPIPGVISATLPLTIEPGSMETLLELAKKLPRGPGPYGRGHEPEPESNPT